MKNWKDYLNSKIIKYLIFRYLTSKKSLSKDLRPLIIKALNFINNDVKSHLGIKVISTPKKNKDQQSHENMPGHMDSSILGGYLFYYLLLFFINSN